MIAQRPTSLYAGTLDRDGALRKDLFSEAVMRHPAKQHIPQLMDLLRRYSVPGGVLVDPFGGSGSAMLAASPQFGGMYVITCELATHFLAIEQEAWDHFSHTLYMQDIYPNFLPGDYWPMQGDSRNLSTVIEANAEAGMPCADLIITSPSYGGSEAVDRRKKQNDTMHHHGGGNVAKAGYTQIARMDDNGMMQRHGLGKHSQLSAEQHGYTDEQDYKSIDYHKGGPLRRLNNSGDAIGVVDTIITSPPYQDAFNKGHNQRAEQIKKRLADGEAVFKDMGKVGSKSGIMLGGYDVTAENIGNQQGKKYLASMRQVWAECAKVLKPGGILCCITRDCIKQSQIVPVGQQNRDLLVEAGLTLVEVLVWKIPTMSFWRTLQHQRYPDAPIIDTEEISVFTKGADHA